MIDLQCIVRLCIRKKYHPVALGGMLMALCLSVYAPAQPSEVAVSRYEEMATPPSASDTARINALIRTALQYQQTRPDTFVSLLREARRESYAVRYTRGELHSLIRLSIHYANKGNHNLALNLMQEAWPLSQISSLSEGGRPLAAWYEGMARIYAFTTEQDSTLLFLRKANYIADKIRDTQLLLRTNFNMACTWLDNGQTDNALFYLKKAEELALHLNSPQWMNEIYSNYAIIHSRRKDTADLLAYAQKALALSSELGDSNKLENSLAILAHYYLPFRPDTAEVLFRKALALNTRNLQTQFAALTGISKIYYMQRRLPLAKKYALEAVERDPSIVFKVIPMLNHYDYMAHLSADMGDFAAAYEYRSAYSRLSDSLNNASRNKALDKLESQYRLAEKDRELSRKELLLLREQNKLKTRNIWIAATSLCVLSLIGLFLSFYRNSRRNLFILKQQEEINRLRAVMEGEEKERSRISRELHDGIGGLLSAAVINLNNLSDIRPDLAGEQVYQKTGMLLDAISNEVRKTAHNLMPDILLSHNLPDAVRLFCSYVQKGKNLNLEVLANGSFETMDQHFLLGVYRIVQELVQNIIKHAGASNAVIQLHSDETIMSITVEDDGCGYDPAAPVTGMGLKNIQARVTTMKGNMSIESSPGKGTSVYIEFDINNAGT
jgi:signal transduction histidine kinase